jgi:hypothetical protein
MEDLDAAQAFRVGTEGLEQGLGGRRAHVNVDTLAAVDGGEGGLWRAQAGLVE